MSFVSLCDFGLSAIINTSMVQEITWNHWGSQGSVPETVYIRMANGKVHVIELYQICPNDEFLRQQMVQRIIERVTA